MKPIQLWKSIRFLSSVLMLAVALCIVANAQQPDQKPQSDTNAALQNAASLAMKGQYKQAIEAYAAHLEAPATRLAAAIGTAECLMETGKYAEAQETLKKAASNDVTPQWHIAMAKVLQQVGQYGVALEHCKKAIGLDAENFEARYLSGVLQEITGQRKAAIETYRWFEEQRNRLPLNAFAYTIAGRAIDRYSILTSQPTKYARFILQDVYQKAGEKLDKTDWRPHQAAAELLLAKYNNKEAVDELKAVLKINPNCVDALVGAAYVELSTWKFENVEKQLEKALEVNPNSLNALCAMAQLRMTERRFADAAEVLEKAIAVNDKHLHALALMAAAKQQLGDPQWLGFSKRYEAINSESGLLEMELAEWLSAARQYPDSEKYYLKAIEKSPELADPRTGLGLMYMQMGHRDKQAREHLEKAFSIDKYHQKTFNTLNLLDELDKFQNNETKHFIVRFDGKTDAVIGYYFTEHLESIYDDVCRMFKHNPSVKTSVEVFPTHDRFSVRTTGLPWIGTVGACTGDVIAMASPSEERKVKPYDWARVLRHEYAHVVTLGATENRMPHWMTEGLAVYAEQQPKQWPWVQMLVNATRRNQLFPVDKITWSFWRPRGRNDRQMAYAQSAWMCEFIIEKWGNNKIQEFIKAFKDRQTQPQALKSVLGLTEKEFDTQFAAWARTQIKSWGFLDQPLMELKDIEKLVQEQPKDIALQAQLAEAQYASKKLDDAIKTAKQCLEKQPTNVHAQTVLAQCLFQQKKPDEAKAAFETVLKLEPKSYIAARFLAQIATDQGKKEEAVAHWTTLHKITALDPASSKALSDYYIAQKKPEKAVEYLLVLDSNNQNDVQLRMQISRLYRQIGKDKEAANHAMRALQIHPFDANVRQELAAIYVGAKDYDKAIRELQINCETQPKVADHFARLAMVYKTAGKMDKAKEAAEAAVKLDPRSPAANLLQQ